MVCPAQGVPVMLVLDSGNLDLHGQVILLGLGIRQAGRVVLLPGIAFSELFGGGLQCFFILTDGVLLVGQLTFQHFQLGGKSGGGTVKALNSGRCQLKVRFCFLDLLIDGLDVPGKVIRIQRQRYDQVAQGISQWLLFTGWAGLK